jgi:hypothetical protein
MAKKISEVSSGEIYNDQTDIGGIIRRHIQWPKRYQRYHQETYTIVKKIYQTSDIFLAIVYVS